MTRAESGSRHPLESRGTGPLRIAYLLESGEFFGGVKVMIMQAEALVRRGHRVTIVSPQPRPDWYEFGAVRFEQAAYRESRALAEADIRVGTFFRTVPHALEGSQVPVFHLCQGYEGEIGFYRDVLPRIREIYGLPTHKLAISPVLAAHLEELGFGPVRDIGQAFDATGFQPGPTRPVHEPPVIFVVGAVEIDFKGVDVVLRGLEIARRRGVPFRLVRASYFAPTDWERELDLADEFHHMIPPERMASAYRAADAFVGGSRPAEGFGLPTLEALACGLPALLSDNPGQRDIGRNAAWYYKDGDPESLADALPGILTEAARVRARVAGPAEAARYDTDRVAERLEAAFAAALIEARGRPPAGVHGRM
ncbi:MAG TPA: glycosyltransferase family 4 protein [Thermoanaerobaculia bacterium]|jgi:glycosyltransferase involved in cell wall biosynthesis|nr:glycosyltransferase family 4 protein [Thermoanaerobaculia bacterium]